MEEDYLDGDYGYVDDGDVSGDVMGDVMGFDVVGRGRSRRPVRGRPRRLAIPQRPAWRNQLAPGVIQPDQGMVPLPLSPQTNNGVFAAAGTSIVFQGQLQKPFRPERLLTSVVRTGVTATGHLLGQLFVGTDLQQADIQGWDVELLGAPPSLGTRLTCKAAEPGVFIRFIITPTAFPTGTDTILLTMLFAGRIVH
jgi:hypothetical protein